jgi:hypothetical protein
VCVCMYMYVCTYVRTYVRMYVCMLCGFSERITWLRIEMADVCCRPWLFGKALYVNRSGKSKLEPCESKHDIRMRVCTVRAKYFVAVFLFSFAVRTECFECRSEAQEWELTSCIHTQVQALKRSVLYRFVLVIFGVETGIVLPSGSSM